MFLGTCSQHLLKWSVMMNLRTSIFHYLLKIHLSQERASFWEDFFSFFRLRRQHSRPHNRYLGNYKEQNVLGAKDMVRGEKAKILDPVLV